MLYFASPFERKEKEEERPHQNSPPSPHQEVGVINALCVCVCGQTVKKRGLCPIHTMMKGGPVGHEFAQIHELKRVCECDMQYQSIGEVEMI